MSITCKQATDYISKKEEGKLSFLQRYQLWQHTVVCSLCKLFYKQNKLLITVLKNKEHKNHEPLHTADKDNIISAMEKIKRP